MFAVYKCVDLKTGVIFTSNKFTTVRSVNENIAMYNRYNDGTMKFSCEVIGDTEDVKAHPNFKHGNFVAKLFPKNDPSTFLNTKGEIWKIASDTQYAAAIYAENGNYEKALEYYRLAISMLDGEEYQCNYQRKLDKIITSTSNN